MKVTALFRLAAVASRRAASDIRASTVNRSGANETMKESRADRIVNTGSVACHSNSAGTGSSWRRRATTTSIASRSVSSRGRLSGRSYRRSTEGIGQPDLLLMPALGLGVGDLPQREHAVGQGG